MDTIVYAGYGFTFGQVDTTNFTAVEKRLFRLLLDSDELDDLVFDNNYDDDKIVVTDSASVFEYFTYIPDNPAVVNGDTPVVKTYDCNIADQLLIQHVRKLLTAAVSKMSPEALGDVLEGDYQFSKAINLIDNIIKKMDIPSLAEEQAYADYC